MDSGGENILLKRTKGFALKIIKTYSRLPRKSEVRIMGYQMLKSG